MELVNTAPLKSPVKKLATFFRLSRDKWKAKYFTKHPAADANNDGKLTWPEYNAYRAKFDPEPAKISQPKVEK